jgi:membrane dipeptidase
MTIKQILISILLVIFFLSCKNADRQKPVDELWKEALSICNENIILDSHIDWPERLIRYPADISGKTSEGDFDFVRAKRGGLNAVLSVVYINSGFGVDEGRIMVDSMLGSIAYYTKNYPDKCAPALNPADVRNNFGRNLLSLPVCLENGAPIGNDLKYLKYLKDKGIVYITLCHDRTNQISDSNFDENREWKGLSPFGVEVIREMNRLGIIIDISHSTDSTVIQSLRYSKSPVVATHSSCRHFTPGFERNLSDTLIKAIAAKNGVIMVNLGSFFLDSICLKNWEYLYNKWQDSTGIDIYSKKGMDFTIEYGKAHKLFSNSRQFVDHIEHVIGLVGIDYVGIGSDYDGIGLAKPVDLPNVSCYPVIVFELLRRGYTEDDIKKILSENFFRVWNDVIEIADSLSIVKDK